MTCGRSETHGRRARIRPAPGPCYQVGAGFARVDEAIGTSASRHQNTAWRTKSNQNPPPAFELGQQDLDQDAGRRAGEFRSVRISVRSEDHVHVGVHNVHDEVRDQRFLHGSLCSLQPHQIRQASDRLGVVSSGNVTRPFVWTGGSSRHGFACTRLMILPRRLRKSAITLSMRKTSSISEGDARWCHLGRARSSCCFVTGLAAGSEVSCEGCRTRASAAVAVDLLRACPERLLDNVCNKTAACTTDAE